VTKKLQILINSILLAALISACAPQQTDTAPTPDSIGTVAAELAFSMMTQTAAAQPTATPEPTETLAPVETETPTPEPLPLEPVATTMPKVIGPAPCYIGGPGPDRPFTSNISDFKDVEMIGIGSVDGWYVIEDPYFYSPCWISAENLKLEADFDLSAYPVIEP
jgi:hypothetical protein